MSMIILPFSIRNKLNSHILKIQELNDMSIVFKPYLLSKSKYKGGKGKADVVAKVGSKKIYKLSSNENMLGTSPKAAEAIYEAIQDLFYYPDRTDVRLRKALERFYNSEIQESDFLCANSAMELLDGICRAFLYEGDNAIACPPAFRAYKLFTGKAGAELINVPLQGENYELDMDGILNAITDRTKLIFLNSPNNPTGTIIPKKSLDTLIERLPDQVVLVLDEVYYHFNEDPDFTNAQSYVKEGKSVIAVNSFSKCFGLAGLRIGYLYSTPEIVSYLRGIQRPFQINSLTLAGAIAALADTEFIDRTTTLIREEKRFLYQSLDTLNVKYWKSQANFIMIQPEMNEKEFEERMLMEGIMVRPVFGFGAPDCIRVTIGTHEANEAFVNALRKVVN